MELDVKWADKTIQRNQADRVELDVKQKTYSTNMINESIRMSADGSGLREEVLISLGGW
ncbi:hypothetical protein HYPSUDRAFT_71860 [Hypholoma sublateritium FD-334 SS-4]|uniref:Uncharacterized protein n=1 Tax=Hypholoma sublateritium (strain FD-334 SS-4) TaxID=945553 RepID=A0A0D2N9E5_HYPSF|nr:hypothetical protein HYPSUDRAFT_71860 [Hypholoma sublateritium FD-334 SS-4]